MDQSYQNMEKRGADWFSALFKSKGTEHLVDAKNRTSLLRARFGEASLNCTTFSPLSSRAT